MTCKWKVFCKQGDTCVAHEGYDVWKCTAFKDKEEPLTNKEWLKQCTTEQLAEWINNIVGDGIIKAWMIKNNCCGDYLESVKWWLKQPHSPK